MSEIIQQDNVEDSYHHYNDIEMECANQEELHQNKRVLKQAAKLKKPEPVLKSKALRWHMPIIGEVPMSK